MRLRSARMRRARACTERGGARIARNRKTSSDLHSNMSIMWSVASRAKPTAKMNSASDQGCTIFLPGSLPMDRERKALCDFVNCASELDASFRECGEVKRESASHDGDGGLGLA